MSQYFEALADAVFLQTELTKIDICRLRQGDVRGQEDPLKRRIYNFLALLTFSLPIVLN
jgi:hypothetical protein